MKLGLEFVSKRLMQLGFFLFLSKIGSIFNPLLYNGVKWSDTL